jgi:hypothetical protein
MIALAIAVGSFVTVVDPGTTTPLCIRVTAVGEGPGGIATVWGVQRESSRGVRAPLTEVRAGCAPGPASLATGTPAPLPAPSPTPSASGPR